ncbi:MAG: serine/threonine protein kinase [Scytolyngbya sp. HA4215-MV1]|jgi:serine/threonine-protein kinase|nr:serine/threonine protein kinase [Scytolyngbya sp. HA4215-MV1]
MVDANLGRLLSNRYQLVELIGRGAMGRVYRAEDTLLGGVVAVKFLAQTLLNRKMRDRFKTEATTCAQLGQKSIHIVRVMDYGVNEEEVPFYVMEYLQGESLSDIINNQPMAVLRFLSLARQICLGLQCAHEGIRIDNQVCPVIHRDIKPSNILVSQDASLGELVKILDFGISKMLQADGAGTTSYMGTLAYSSPEQMEGKELDARSDIYSLGVMMYEMLTGKMPLQAETHSFGSWYKAHHFQPPRAFGVFNLTQKLPNGLEELVMRCLEKSPHDRPQSIHDVLKALTPLEQYYSGNRQLSKDIGERLAKEVSSGVRTVKPTPKSNDSSSSSEDVCRLSSWPKNKPIAQIVFPQILTSSQGKLATLWVMLQEEEIETLKAYRLYNKVYKNFLCSMAPHPMVLWLTAVYNRFHHIEKGPRWLRCYLDLKDPLGHEMLRLLSTQGEYQVLFFALEKPQNCAHVITVKLPMAQCNLMQEWVITSRNWHSIGEPTMSKNMLQAEFEKLKPKVSAELETQSTKSSLNLSDVER